jgi:O-antigen/teichoic acid export membrane protein
MTETGEQPGLGTRTLRGAAWAYGAYLGARAAALVATAILARLLDPSDFGLVALALVFITFADTISDLGLGDALVISSDEDEAERADTAFVLLTATGLGLTLLTVAVAPFAARFFDEPRLTPMMMVLGLNFVLRALGGTHFALAQRRIDFRSRTGAEVADAVVRGATGIALALAGLGAWSLVIGYLAGSLAMTIVLWALVPWRPRLGKPGRHTRSMLSFGGRITAVGVLFAVMQQVDYVFVGRVLGTAALGLYTIAYRLPELLIASLSVVAGQVLFPAFAVVDRDRLAAAFTRSVRFALMIGLPFSVGLIVLADPVVHVLFGDAWHGAVDAMRVLAAMTLVVPASMIAGVAIKSLGRADVLIRVSVPQTIALIAAIAVFVDQGIVAVAFCQLGVRLVFAALAVWIALRLVGVSLADLARASAPPVVAAAACGAVMLAAGALGSPVAELVVGAVAGAAVYCAVLWLMAADALREVWRTAMPDRAPLTRPADPTPTLTR